MVGVVVSGVRDRTGPAGWVAVLATLCGATLSDWLDGPLARHYGPTRLGAVLDIEADSWLTMWAAAAAVAWGELPHWCLLAPLLHYAHAARALWRGTLPRGGGPWWMSGAVRDATARPLHPPASPLRASMHPRR